MALAVAGLAEAQGKSQAPGNGNGHKSVPPSSSPLPSAGAGPTVGAAPLAWLDDATLLPPGSVLLTVSTARWSGADLSEVDAPVVDASMGLAPRFQIGATVPRIVGGADGAAPVGGVGTSYFSAKIGVLTGEHQLRVAVTPMLEILGEGAVQALNPGDHRTHVGLPVSAEIRQGAARLFASAGAFSGGRRFAGGGVGVQATPTIGVSISLTRSWVNDDTNSVTRDRQELGGGMSYLVRPGLGIYGALSRTFATSDENGAGTTISAGVSVLFAGDQTKGRVRP